MALPGASPKRQLALSPWCVGLGRGSTLPKAHPPHTLKVSTRKQGPVPRGIPSTHSLCASGQEASVFQDHWQQGAEASVTVPYSVSTWAGGTQHPHKAPVSLCWQHGFLPGPACWLDGSKRSAGPPCTQRPDTPPLSMEGSSKSKSSSSTLVLDQRTSLHDMIPEHLFSCSSGMQERKGMTLPDGGCEVWPGLCLGGQSSVTCGQQACRALSGAGRRTTPSDRYWYFCSLLEK